VSAQSDPGSPSYGDFRRDVYTHPDDDIRHSLVRLMYWDSDPLLIGIEVAYPAGSRLDDVRVVVDRAALELGIGMECDDDAVVVPGVSIRKEPKREFDQADWIEIEFTIDDGKPRSVRLDAYQLEMFLGEVAERSSFQLRGLDFG
jgi:hypothetical protein